VSFVEDFHEKKTVQSDFFEVASSCKETEYSLNPQHKDLSLLKRQIITSAQELTGKQIQRMKMENTRKSITRNLKEENDRATSTFAPKQ
jgi:hypothetical protein